MSVPFIVKSTSLDWCGCESESYIVFANTEDEAVEIAVNKGIEDEVRDFYTSEEDDDDFIADPAITTNAIEYNVSEDGDISLYTILE